MATRKVTFNVNSAYTDWNWHNPISAAYASGDAPVSGGTITGITCTLTHMGCPSKAPISSAIAYSSTHLFAEWTNDSFYVDTSDHTDTITCIGWDNDILSETFTSVTIKFGGADGSMRFNTGATVEFIITYTLPYTACTAPTSVSVDKASPLIGTTVTVSWSGAAAGTNNAITKYEIYRCATSGGTYTHLTGFDVTTSATSGSKSGIEIPATIGGTYFFKIKVIGTVAGYDSALSAYVQITTSAPTIKRKNAAGVLEDCIAYRKTGSVLEIVQVYRRDASTLVLVQ